MRAAGRFGLAIALTMLATPAANAADRGAAAGPAARAGAVDRRADCLRRNADVPPRYAAIVAAFCAEHHNLAGAGASLAIAEGGTVTLVASAGVGCFKGQVVSPATRFRIGSVSKTLTAALVLRLVDAGLIELDAPVVRALPELGAGVDDRAARITWRQLLMHTSGLPDPPPSELQGAGDWLQALGERPLWRDPGSLWSYSSDGYAVVGAAIEVVLGTGYETALRSWLLAPSGVAEIAVSPDMSLKPDTACGHLGRGDAAAEFTVAQDLELGAGDARWTAPAGGAIASAEELVRLALALTDPSRSPLSPAARAELLQLGVATDERPGEFYGLGLRARVLADGAWLFAHRGNTGDFAADLVFAPDRGLAMALLANNGDHLGATAALALTTLLGVEPERAAPRAPLATYAGTYAHAGWGEQVAIDVRGDQLLLDAPQLGLAAIALEHAGDHRFRIGGRPDLGGFTFLFAADPAQASDLRGRLFVGARVE